MADSFSKSGFKFEEQRVPPKEVQMYAVLDFQVKYYPKDNRFLIFHNEQFVSGHKSIQEALDKVLELR